MQNRIAAREPLTLTPQQLADTTGAALSARKSGSANPSVEDMAAVARALALPVGFLLCREVPCACKKGVN